MTSDHVFMFLGNMVAGIFCPSGTNSKRELFLFSNHSNFARFLGNEFYTSLREITSTNPTPESLLSLSLLILLLLLLL